VKEFQYDYIAKTIFIEKQTQLLVEFRKGSLRLSETTPLIGIHAINLSCSLNFLMEIVVH
jgi:hypothetical protein